MNNNPSIIYGGFWLRFWAYLIDLAVIQGLRFILLGTIFNIFSLNRGSGILSAYGFLNLVLFLTYFILMTKITNGQTLGKMILGLRVISLEEDVLTWHIILFREGIGRYILQAIPLGILYIVTAFTGKKQGIADLFADTVVVKEDVYLLTMELDATPNHSFLG